MKIPWACEVGELFPALSVDHHGRAALQPELLPWETHTHTHPKQEPLLSAAPEFLPHRGCKMICVLSEPIKMWSVLLQSNRKRIYRVLIRNVWLRGWLWDWTVGRLGGP